MSSHSSSQFSRWRRDLRRYLRRFKTVTVVYLTVLVLVAAGGLCVLIAIPISRAIRGWHARRLSEQAMGLIDRQQWKQATEKTRDALILRPSEPATWEAAARLLTKTGHGSSALAWWKEFSKSHELSVSDRRDYAAAALGANELGLAATQIDLLCARQAGPDPVDLCLAAELATLRGDSQAAATKAEQVLQDKRTAPGELFYALVIIFLNSTSDSPSYLDAFQRVVELARTDNGRAGLEALRLIAKSPPRPRLTDDGSAPVTIIWPKDAAISHKEIADRLEQHPNARPADRLLALQVRLQDEPDHTDEYVKQAIESFGKGDDETVAALAAWLYESGRFQTILDILTPQLVASNRELFVERVDALAALNRYADLEAMLQEDNLPLDQISPHLYLAAVESRLGKTPASEKEWAQALQTATDTQQFLRVAKYAEEHGAFEIADAAYKQILVLEPRLRQAYLARLRLAQMMGRTADAEVVAAEIVKLWPDDTPTRLRNWYLQLLLGGSPAEIATIEKEVEDSVSRTSLGAETLSLARLRSGRPAAALSAFTFQGVPVALATTSAMTVHAAALAANGWKDKARDEAKKLPMDKLLPEERTLLAPLLSGDN